MPDGLAVRIEVDGTTATTEQLRGAVLNDYGHFTAMQVRGGRVRGLGLHLARLDAANREILGSGLDTATVRARIRRALDETADASVRVYVRETPGGPSVMVTVRPPGGMPPGPWRLQTVPYQRPLAHVKHLSDFGQSHFQRTARRAGFDEALLTGPGGVISEGSVTNIAFFDGTGIVWPAAPALHGITMQILEQTLPAHGIASRRGPVRTADLRSFTAAFVTSARGIAPVGQIDGVTMTTDRDVLQALADAYESAAWDPI